MSAIIGSHFGPRPSAADDASRWICGRKRVSRYPSGILSAKPPFWTIDYVYERAYEIASDRRPSPNRWSTEP
jgi:hypothetical protein